MSEHIAPVLDAPGLVRMGGPEVVYGAQPAAGAHYTSPTANYGYWRVVSVFVKLVADANVASREVVVEYRDADNNRLQVNGINTTVTASNTAYYSFSFGQPEAVATVDSTALVPLTPLLLPRNYNFRIYVVSIQATDQLSQIRFVRENFSDAGPAPGRDYRPLA